MASSNASGQYQRGDILINLVAILLLTTVNVPAIGLLSGYSWVIGAVFDGGFLTFLQSKQKKIWCRADIQSGR